MKKLMLLMAVMMMGSSMFYLSAQPRGGAPMERERDETPQKRERVEVTAEQVATRKSEMLKKEFELSDAQYEAIYALQLESAKKMISEREEMAAKREAAKAEAEAKREASNAEMKSILTPEQYEKFLEREKRGGQKGGQQGRPAPRGERDQRGKPQGRPAPRGEREHGGEQGRHPQMGEHQGQGRPAPKTAPKGECKEGEADAPKDAPQEGRRGERRGRPAPKSTPESEQSEE